MRKNEVATREAYGQALVELGAEFPEIVVLDADLSKSTMTAKFAAAYPDRFFNMGIAEANMMGVAAGLAASGKIPFASTFAVFATGRAFDQVRQSIGYPGLNVKIAASHAGVTVGADGASHQSIEDIALMRTIPGMTVIVPADASETREACRAAVLHRGPVYLRLGRQPTPVLREKWGFQIGRATQLRDGTDVTIVACGVMVNVSLQAATLLEDEGISAEVLNMSTLKPLDITALLEAARRTGALVCAEEHSTIGGLGSAVSQYLASEYPVPVKCVGIRDSFGQSGSAAELMEFYGLTPQAVAKAAVEAVGMKRRK
ncbi:MAG TPA: transketolase family protein [Firmicutes bacterium]|nr:transketolase family protein [Bacillota bacterium]